MTESLKKLLPHFVVGALFVMISLFYFAPVLQGKMIFQSDIVQYIGMSEERDQFRETSGEESYWTNAAFGGMPTYQLGAHYPHDYIKKIDQLLRFLPRPADYLFLYLIGFYILLLVLRVNWKLAAAGALAFGFSTYLIIILGVGHNAKAHAIGYFPLVIAGVLLVFQKRWITGGILSVLALALEISANHFQMTYYLLFLLGIISLVYAVNAIRQGAFADFVKSAGVLLVAGILALGANATNLMATSEYAKWSTRGSSALTLDPEGQPKQDASGLSRDYITEYSYGKAESLNLLVPRLFGGSNNEDLGKDSQTYKFLISQGVPADQAEGFTSGLPLYWGDQPIVAAPAYIGATIALLFVLGLFLVENRHKWWLVSGALLSLVLSWGKNLSWLTDLMIDYVPLYNKFRAVSSVQVLLELCVPVLGILGVAALLNSDIAQERKRKALLWSSGILGGLFVLLFLIKGSFNFSAGMDAYYENSFGRELVDQIRQDRMNVYNADLFRSLILAAAVALLLLGYLRNLVKKELVYLALAILFLIDLGGVAKRYVNADDFVNARVYNKPFQADFANLEILKDTAYFRVFDVREGLNGAKTSFFHQSVGGYHAAKPRRLQELFQYQVNKNNLTVLNMLNVKYLIQQNDNGQAYPARNPMALGPAWFVQKLEGVDGADAEMNALDQFNPAQTAVFDTTEQELKPARYELSDSASIRLLKHAPNALLYESANANPGFAVFSEMHYPHGWKAFLDGEETPVYRVNYLLRGLEIPAGKHRIEFKFEPEVVATGSVISLSANLLIALLIVLALGYAWKQRGSEALKD